MRPRYLLVAALALALSGMPAGADTEQEAADRTYGELDQFQAWIGEQIDTLEREIAELQQELQERGPEARERINEMLQQAEALAADLRAQADRAGEATAEQWESAKASALSGWHRVQAAYYAALAELRGEDGSEN